MSYCGTKWLMVVCTSLALNCLYGQSIWTNPITGTNPNTSNPYTTGDVVDMNITVSGIGRGAGLISEDSNDRYNARGWNSTSLDIGDYFSFILSPNDKYKITFGSFVYTAQRSPSSGPLNFAFRTSLDGFMSNLGTATSTGATIDLSMIAEVKYPDYVEFRLYAWGASTAGGTFSVNNFAFNAAVALPIELLSFTHKIEQNQIHLNWSTATEKNNDYMAIERSVDGQNFSEIGRVQGAGNSVERIDYSFIDRFPYPGTNYYRLRQVDFDGMSTAYKIVAVEFNGTSENALDITQNPEAVNIQFHAPNAAGQLVLVDAIGRIIRAQKFEENVPSARISIHNLPKGFYVVQIRQIDGLIKAKSLIK